MADGSGPVRPMKTLEIDKINEYTRFGWQIERLIDAYKEKQKAKGDPVESIAIVIDVHKKNPGGLTPKGVCCSTARKVMKVNSDSLSLMRDMSVESVEGLPHERDMGGPIILGCQPCEPD